MLAELIKIITLVSLLIFIAACSDEQPPVGRMRPVLNLDEPVPDFEFKTLVDPAEQPVKLSSYQGKVIYLDFWASWCKACLKSMPYFNQIREHLHSSGFEVLAVNLDDVIDNGKKFIEEHPVSYPVIRAVNEDISHIYQLNGLPTGFLIDRDGILRHVHQGFNKKDMQDIKKQIILLLK